LAFRFFIVMTVTGTTTAQVAATSYVPPFKYVTSYGPAPQVTGIIAGNVTATVSGEFRSTVKLEYALTDLRGCCGELQRRKCYKTIDAKISPQPQQHRRPASSAPMTHLHTSKRI
jgi:hypothetical protein